MRIFYKLLVLACIGRAIALAINIIYPPLPPKECRVPDPDALDIIRRGASRIVRVSDAEVAAAMRAIYTDTHNVAEGAGAASYAGLLQERELQSGQRVAVILTGGNVDALIFASVLRGETPVP